MIDQKPLETILNAVVKLTKVKIEKCGHVNIPNFSSDCFKKLMVSYILIGGGNKQIPDVQMQRLSEYAKENNTNE